MMNNDVKDSSGGHPERRSDGTFQKVFYPAEELRPMFGLPPLETHVHAYRHYQEQLREGYEPPSQEEQALLRENLAGSLLAIVEAAMDRGNSITIVES
jgi:hypothetical protein